MLMPGRKYSSGNSSYRYGFNGQEKSDDVTTGNYTAEYWEYDSRICRRWNVDPKSTADESPYTANNNNPILMSDPDGDFPGLGFLVGMITEIIIQTVEIKLGIRTEYNIKEIIISGVMTQVGMGVAKQISRIKTLGKLGKAAVEIAGDVAVNSAEQYLKTGSVNPMDALFNAGVSRGISKGVEKIISNNKEFKRLQANVRRKNRDLPKSKRAAETERAVKAVEGYVELRTLPAAVTGTSVASKIKDGVQSSLSSNEPAAQTNTKANDMAVAANTASQITPQRQETKSEQVARYTKLREEDYMKNGRIRKSWTDADGVQHSSDKHNPNYKIPKNLDKNY